MEAGEKLFAHLDDLCIVCRPERVGASVLFWKAICGTIPGSQSTRGRRKCGTGAGQSARVGLPTAVVWRGDSELLPHQQGFKVLSIPLGHPDFVQRFLEGKIGIPEVPDTQSAWLLLSFCAAARANFFLRGVNPDQAKWFAAAHVQGVWQCFCQIMQILPTCGAQELSSLPMWGIFRCTPGKHVAFEIVTFHQKKSSKTTFIKNHIHQNHFHPNHFHQNPISSKSNFTQNHFHQNPISSRPFSSKSNFIKIQFHPKPFHPPP